MALIKSELMFPRLNRAEIALLTRFGNERSTSKNETLFDSADSNVSVFVVLQGRLDIVRPFKNSEALLVSHGPREFSGGENLISGGPGSVRGKTKIPSRLLEIERVDLLHAQTHPLLSETFLRSYLLRRAFSPSSVAGDSLLVGSSHSGGTLRVKAFLERNAHPYTYLDLDRDSGVQWLLDQFAVRADEIPILICGGRTVLRNPSNAMISAVLDAESIVNHSNLWDIEISVFSPGGD
ncbi:MAG TPA: cyclic nucleotide-binding domain-containing protein [Terracidiphilus sp.]|jgi:thioredoxin reductase (NADPH)